MDGQDLNEHKYDQYLTQISKFLEAGKDWEEIKYACRGDIEGLRNYIQLLTDSCVFSQAITPETWIQLVEMKKRIEKKRVSICERDQSAILTCGECAPSAYQATAEEDSFAISQYKKLLAKRDFHKYVIDNLDSACRETMKYMSQDTTQTGPVKGLLIGDVQSGKTANMAGLMALTADYGWNFYIIFSGTIDNLRKQTQTRLINDLTESPKTKLSWTPHDYLDPRSIHKLSSLNLNDYQQKHLTVCLKQSKRIADLIKWFNCCPDNAAKIKLVIIDDEADQASINTANIDDDEKSRIFGLISDLVECKGRCHVKFKAVNYISYTATPYANILNDASSDSLFPMSFIYTLPSSFAYFGPKMIFGSQRDENIKGMSILENIPPTDIGQIESIHNGNTTNLPTSMQEALAWFLCGVSALRHRQFQKPLTMLIHTSQLQRNQASMAKAVEKWLKKTDKDTLVQYCQQIYSRETAKFNKETLAAEYPNYDDLQEVQDFPAFDEFSHELSKLIDESIQHIEIDDEGELKYCKGIHLCVDNCSNNKSYNNKYLRILYPDDTDKSVNTPAFIVIGGNTLSRGLTLKGLFTSYFLRVVKQADTLMQMGRWFGYRPKYEIYQRIWMTEDTKEKFQFLSDLNEDLKAEIEELSKSGMKPLDYKAKIMNTPKLSWLRLTSKNKMQNAIPAAWDFAGSIPETNFFLREKIAYNYGIVTEFLSKLGQTPKRSTIPGSPNYFWADISFETIEKELLEKYAFPSISRQFNEIETFISWLKETSEKYNNWTVIAAGINSKNKAPENVWTLPGGHRIGKITRTIQVTGQNSEYAQIRVLNSKIDYLTDIDFNAITDTNCLTAIKQKAVSKSYKEIREKQKAYAETPLLILYCVDHAASPTKGTTQQVSGTDLMGLSFYIPGRRLQDNSTVVSHLTVRQNFSENPDIDESGEE